MCNLNRKLKHIFCFFGSFPHTKREKWENIFPTCTSNHEISLVDELVAYCPSKRLSAESVRDLLIFFIQVYISIYVLTNNFFLYRH